MENNCPPQAQIMQIASSKMAAKPLYVAAQLKIADYLAAGPKSTAELARKTKTHEPSLYRLLRALAAVGVFAETSPRTFTLTPAAELLKDEPASMRAFVLFFNDPLHDKVWDHLLWSVKTGKPAFKRALGREIFDFFSSPHKFAGLFHAAMTSLAANNIRALVDTYNFSGVRTLVDVGGGHGALMRAILRKNPQMNGIVYDLPKVAAGAKKAIQKEGMSGRCQAVGGDFFKAVPKADAAIMSHIIHDWDDKRCAAILAAARKAVGPEGRVLVVETVIPEGNAFSPAKLLDLEMLIMPGGMERTEAEYRALFAKAGLRLERAIPTPSGMSVLEAVSATDASIRPERELAGTAGA